MGENLTKENKKKGPNMILDLAYKIYKDTKENGNSPTTRLNQDKELTIECQLKTGYTNEENERKEETVELKILKEIDTKEGEETFKKCVRFLERFFTPDQLVSEESFALKFKGKTLDGKDRVKYHFLYIENEDREIIGVRVYELLPSIKEGKKDYSNLVFYGIYIAIQQGSGEQEIKKRENKKDYARMKLAWQLYISSLIHAEQEAKQKNGSVEYMCIEGNDKVETIQNGLGLKRIYLKQEDNSYKELRYKQPEMTYDPKTGKPRGSHSREHLMIHKFAKDSKITKEDVKATVFALYEQQKSTAVHKEFFEKNIRDKAYKEYLENFSKYEKEIEEQLNSATEIILLSKEERSQKKEEGWQIEEWEKEPITL